MTTIYTLPITTDAPERRAAYREIARAPEGAKIEARYPFTGDTSEYTITVRAGKRRLTSRQNSRGHVFTGPASIERILGRPTALTLTY